MSSETDRVIELEAVAVGFYSQLDEAAFFEWIAPVCFNVRIADGDAWWRVALYGLVLAVAGMIGDLAESQTASTSAASIALSKALRKQGWRFVGPTTVYAFMQAMGLINDHVTDCVTRAEVARARDGFERPK